MRKRKSINEDALNVVQKKSEQNEDGEGSDWESLEFHLTQSRESKKKVESDAKIIVWEMTDRKFICRGIKK